MLPGPITCTVPPLKLPPSLPVLLLAVGVTTIVMVAVDPDCSDIGPQLTLPLVELLLVQLPELMLAELNVSGTIVAAELRSSVTVIPLARSGPLFVSV